MRISNDLLMAYLFCKYKAFLKYKGKTGEISNYEKFVRELEVRHQREAKRSLLQKNKNVVRKQRVTTNDLAKGNRLLVHATIKHRDLLTRTDGLERITGKSDLGNFLYIPILFIHKNKVTKKEKTLLAFMAYVLESIQGGHVQYGKVLYGDLCKISKLDLKRYRVEVISVIEEIRNFACKNRFPKLRLNDHCRTCEFQRACEEQAREKDDLSLLRGMKKRR